MKELERYFPIAEAVSNVLYPHAEVVIHDLKSGKIAALYNAFSKRKVGDVSLIEDLLDQNTLPDVFEVYSKTNWDGRALKSSSATIRDADGKPIGLFCINIDLSEFSKIQEFVQSWTKRAKAAPKVLFADDWREKINDYISSYLKKERKTIQTMSKKEMELLIHTLYKEGAFEAKHAATYIADVLHVSRATIYNYLKRKK
jgi:predicted transcriptional regulator YheO